MPTPQKRVILAAVEPFNVLLRLPAALVPLRTGLDAVQLDGLLRLLDGTVELTFAYLAALLVGNGIEGNQLGEVVLVAVLLLQTALNKCLRAVEIRVVSSIERVPPTALGSVVLRTTGSEHQENQQEVAGFLAFLY